MALRCSLGRACGHLPLPSLVSARVFPMPTDMSTPNQGSRESCKVCHLPLTLALPAAMRYSLPRLVLPSALQVTQLSLLSPQQNAVISKPTRSYGHQGPQMRPLSHGLLAPLSLTPHHLCPLGSVTWSGLAGIERQHENRSAGHQERRRRAGPGASSPSQKRQVSGKNKFQCLSPGCAEASAGHQCHLAHSAASS